MLIVFIQFSCFYRSDEDEQHSAQKYTRMEDDNLQDKERFARWVPKLISWFPSEFVTNPSEIGAAWTEEFYQVDIVFGSFSYVKVWKKRKEKVASSSFIHCGPFVSQIYICVTCRWTICYTFWLFPHSLGILLLEIFDIDSSIDYSSFYCHSPAWISFFLSFRCAERESYTLCDWFKLFFRFM